MTKRPFKILKRTEVRDLPFQIVEPTEDLVLAELNKIGKAHPKLIAEKTGLERKTAEYHLIKLVRNGTIEDLGIKTILENGTRKKAHIYGVKE